MSWPAINKTRQAWKWEGKGKGSGLEGEVGQACITVLRCFRRVSETVLELRESFSSRATRWLMVEGAREKY